RLARVGPPGSRCFHGIRGRQAHTAEGLLAGPDGGEARKTSQDLCAIVDPTPEDPRAARSVMTIAGRHRRILRAVTGGAMARGGWTHGPVDEGSGPSLRMLPLRGRPDLRAARPLLILVGIVALFFTSYYQIEPDEVGVVQRFGRYVETSNP